MSSCRLVFGLRVRCDVMQCTARVFGSCLLDGAMHIWDCPFLVRSFVVGSRPGAPRKGGSGKGSSDGRGGGERQKAQPAVPPKVGTRRAGTLSGRSTGQKSAGVPECLGAWEELGGALGTWGIILVGTSLPSLPCPQPASWYSMVYSVQRESTCDCSSPTAYVLQHVSFSSGPFPVAQHQSGPALGSTVQHVVTFRSGLIDHSLTHSLIHSPAFALRQRRSQPASCN